jgi:hypothetical protein
LLAPRPTPKLEDHPLLALKSPKKITRKLFVSRRFSRWRK